VTARRAKRENGGLGEDPPGSTMTRKKDLRAFFQLFYQTGLVMSYEGEESSNKVSPGRGVGSPRKGGANEDSSTRNLPSLPSYSLLPGGSPHTPLPPVQVQGPEGGVRML
jgi:hypothetical protein